MWFIEIESTHIFKVCFCYFSYIFGFEFNLLDIGLQEYCRITLNKNKMCPCISFKMQPIEKVSSKCLRVLKINIFLIMYREFYDEFHKTVCCIGPTSSKIHFPKNF
jgi:hypothetical protein